VSARCCRPEYSGILGVQSRGRPKFGFGFGGKSGPVYSFGLLSATAESQIETFGSLSAGCRKSDGWAAVAWMQSSSSCWWAEQTSSSRRIRGDTCGVREWVEDVVRQTYPRTQNWHTRRALNFPVCRLTHQTFGFGFGRKCEWTFGFGRMYCVQFRPSFGLVRNPSGSIRSTSSAKYCDEQVCLPVCLSVCLRNNKSELYHKICSVDDKL